MFSLVSEEKTPVTTLSAIFILLFSRKNIETFIDDNLQRGDEISLSLLDAIQASSISVIIFSGSYASSRWCLDELLEIMKCMNNYGQIVIPVFYRVDPSHVRKQSGVFGEFFSKLRQRFPEKMQRWSNALTEAANLSGFPSHVIRPESKLIEEITNEVLERLDDTFQSENKDLVGIESRIKKIESLLGIGSTDVCKLGIWGIGGIGKTTIAGAIFNKISKHFEASYFARNVREAAEETGRLDHLRQELLFALLGCGNLPNIDLNFQSKRLTRKKVLIVFDDLNNQRQIELLIGSLDRFASGSQIIITARDKQVLTNCQVDKIYKVKELVDADALKLFSQCAFGGGQHPNPNARYVELTHKVIKYAHGVPLALKVLGHSLSGKGEKVWESAIRKLEIVPQKEIQEVLKISYDGLDDHEQKNFLDIACFFVGKGRDEVVNFLDGCGFYAEIGLNVLVDKSLVTISSFNRIKMHDLLRDMGREIVRQQCINDPGNRSRLWHHKDIYEVFTESTVTKAIEGISLDMSKVNEMHINPCTFTTMKKLRLLKFYGRENKFMVSHFQGVWLKELRLLEWPEYPLQKLNVHTENLVKLELYFSKLEQLWDGSQNLANLKEMNLSYSKQLTKLPDLSQAQNLERLICFSCSSLIETHSSIKDLNKLVCLLLDDCRSLTYLPDIIRSESLEELGLSGCSNLKMLPEMSSRKIEKLVLYGTQIKVIPPSIGRLSKLHSIDLNRTELEYIPSSIFKSKSLIYLRLNGCSNLKSLPELDLDESGIEVLPPSNSKLNILHLKNCSRLESLPSSLCMLKSLRELEIRNSPNLQRLPDEIGNLEALKWLIVEGTAIREVPSSIGRLNNLECLEIISCRGGHERMGLLLPSLNCLHTDCGITELPESLGQLSSLEEMFLCKNNFDSIPESWIHLSKLRKLKLCLCERLQSLPELPCNLQYLEARHCKSLESISGLSTSLDLLQSIDLKNCFKRDPNELCEIVTDYLQKFHLKDTAPRWTRSKEQEYSPSREFYFPGNEIPKWFMFQSLESASIEKMPPGFLNIDNLVGFAFCVIVAFPDQRVGEFEYHILRCECEIKSEDSLRICKVRCLSSYDENENFESDPVILGCCLFDKEDMDDPVILGRCLFDKVDMDDCGLCVEVIKYQACANTTLYFNDEEGKVKKCGFHLLYMLKLLWKWKRKRKSDHIKSGPVQVFSRFR